MLLPPRTRATRAYKITNTKQIDHASGPRAGTGEPANGPQASRSNTDRCGGSQAAVSGPDDGTAGDGESSSPLRSAPTRSFLTTSGIFIKRERSSARAGLFFAVFRALEATMPAAHSEASPTVAPEWVFDSMTARKPSGVRREKLGSREAGDHDFL